MTRIPSGALADLTQARRLLNSAEVNLLTWREGQGADRVRAGHDAVERIDELQRELTRVRDALTGELRRDAIERDARVDALLAELRAEREARQEDTDRRPGVRRTPGTGVVATRHAGTPDAGDAAALLAKFQADRAEGAR